MDRKHKPFGRGKALVYCGSRDGRACDGNWSTGRLLFDSASGHVVSYWSNPLYGHLHWGAVVGHSTTLCFNASGLLQGPARAFFLLGWVGRWALIIVGSQWTGSFALIKPFKSLVCIDGKGVFVQQCVVFFLCLLCVLICCICGIIVGFYRGAKYEGDTVGAAWGW